MIAITERDLRLLALKHPCPTCGADADVRCRTVTRKPWTPADDLSDTPTNRKKVTVHAKPCPDRASLAWREHLNREVC